MILLLRSCKVLLWLYFDVESVRLNIFVHNGGLKEGNELISDQNCTQQQNYPNTYFLKQQMCLFLRNFPIFKSSINFHEVQMYQSF